MLLLAAFQVVVFNHIHLWGYAMPLITPLMLLYLPINEGRITTMLRLFFFGLVIDVLSGTPGQHAASLTLCAFLRPAMLRLTLPKEHLEDMVPSVRTMRSWGHFMLLLLVCLTNHTAFFALESMNYISTLSFLITWLSSIVLSMLIMMAADHLRDRQTDDHE